MGEVNAEIENAIKALKLTDDDIHLLSDLVGEEVFKDYLMHFVKSGDRRWWWEDFKQPFFRFKDFDKPFEQLSYILSFTKKKVWLIVEDDYESFYPVYEANPAVISRVIGECFGFEYYIIDKNKEWLLCENHHNALIGIGTRLKEANLDKVV